MMALAAGSKDMLACGQVRLSDHLAAQAVSVATKIANEDPNAETRRLACRTADKIRKSQLKQ